MNRHVSAEALLCRGNGSICCRSRSDRFSRCSFFLLFAGGQDAVDRLQSSVGSNRGAGQRFNAVLTVGEGAALTDELIGECRFGSPLAQARGFIRGINGQRLDFVFSVQGHMNRHVTAEALLSRGNGIFVRRCCFRLFGRFFHSGFRGRFLRRFLTGDSLVDRLQSGSGGHCRAGQGFNSVLTEGEGAVLADELLGEFRVGSPLAKAFGFVGRINGQFLNRLSVQDNMGCYVTAEALFRRFRFGSPRGQVLCQRVILQRSGSAEHAGHSQDNCPHQYSADRDPDPLFLCKIVHFLPSINSEWS